MPSSSTRHRARALALIGAFALLAATPTACGGDDVTGPAAARGHWRLVAIDGAPPANRIAAAEDGANAQIDSIELIFRRYGRMQDIRHLWRQPMFGPPIHFSDSMIVTYAVRGDSIFITRERPVASETYADTGTIDGDTMEIAVRMVSSGQPLFPIWRYARIGETP